MFMSLHDRREIGLVGIRTAVRYLALFEANPDQGYLAKAYQMVQSASELGADIRLVAAHLLKYQQ